jgi:hypothetical protein
MTAPGSSLAYEHIEEGLRSARLVGRRSLKVGKDEVECFVVTAVYSPVRSGRSDSVLTSPITYWIDAETKVVVQQTFEAPLKIPGQSQPRTETSTTTLLRYRLNPELPESPFTFRPARGSAGATLRGVLRRRLAATLFGQVTTTTPLKRPSSLPWDGVQCSSKDIVR